MARNPATKDSTIATTGGEIAADVLQSNQRSMNFNLGSFSCIFSDLATTLGALLGLPPQEKGLARVLLSKLSRAEHPRKASAMAQTLPLPPPPPGTIVLRICFPVYERAAAKVVWADLHERCQEWRGSSVTDVYTDPSITRPPNVPGTLGFIVVRRIPAGSTTLAEELQQATLRAKQVRGETRILLGQIVGVCSPNGVPIDLNLQLDEKKLTVPKLELQNVESILRGLHWSVHFVIRKNDQSASALSTLDAARILQSLGFRVQQTMRYFSGTMEQDNTQPSLVCTSFYESEEMAVEEAQRLRDASTLIKALAERGYSLTLYVERLLACFRTESPHTSTRTPEPVTR